jgi:short-subunit dehydrogenase
MKKIIENNVVLITGADGGIGSALVEELIKRKVKKIYATGTKKESVFKLKEKAPQTIEPLVLDVTNTENIAQCVNACNDLNILINNAGVELKIPFTEKNAQKAAEFEMKVNYLGVIEMINQFTPILSKNNNAHIINIMSLASVAIIKRLGTYCASKAATHILTNTIRDEYKKKNIHVVGVYPGYVNTAMVPEEIAYKKTEPFEIAFEICQGIEAGKDNIFPDEMSKNYFYQNPITINYFE